MTSLSWFLYIADVVENVRGAAQLGCFLFGVTALGAIIFNIFAAVDDMSYLSSDDKKTISKMTKILSYSLLLCLVLNTFAPSSRTVYTIAGIETGYSIAMNESNKEIVTKVYKLVNQQLDKLTADKKD